jgi:hypothetical protein
MTEDYTKNINADAKTVQKDDDKKSISKSGGKLKSAVVKDVISQRGRTVGGGRPDDININPVLKIMEASERHAVVAFGRMNPPTTGHEKLIHKVEDTAKETGGEAHIIATHTEGNPKNPLPSKAKVGYIKKFVKPDTKVISSSKDSPTLLHQLSNLHNSGVKHVTMVAGSDRVREFHDLIHKYNGKQGAHGHYDFKSIKVVSAGGRDPDAEGTTGISGTKMREYAHAGNEKKFKSGLPKALHPHAKEIMGHITKTDESFNNVFELLADNSIHMIEESFMEIAKDIADITEKQYKSIEEKSIKSGIDIDRLIEEYKFAYVLYQCAPHKNMTAEQWSFSAVNTLIANESKDEPWDNDAPSSKHRTLSPRQKAKAKARAKAAGRPYPNWVDNIWAVNEDATFTDLGVPASVKLYAKKKPETKEAIDKNNPDSRLDASDSLVSIYTKDTPGQKNKRVDVKEISNELIGRVNTMRRLGPDISKGISPTPHKTTKGAETLAKAVDRVRNNSKVGAPPMKEDVELEEAIKINSKVKIHAPGKDYHGEVGRVGEIRHGLHKTAPKTYTIDYGNRQSIQLDKKNIKLHKEDIDSMFEEKFGKEREAVARSGQDRKKMSIVPRDGEDRKTDDRFYRQQSIEKKVIEGIESIDELSKEKLKAYTTDANKQIMSRKLPLKKEISREKSVYTAQKKIMKKIWNEAKDKGEYDYEGDMAMSQLRSIMHNAQQIHAMLKPDTNMPEWVQSKITLAADYISTCSDYLQSNEKDLGEDINTSFKDIIK